MKMTRFGKASVVFIIAIITLWSLADPLLDYKYGYALRPSQSFRFEVFKIAALIISFFYSLLLLGVAVVKKANLTAFLTAFVCVAILGVLEIVTPANDTEILKGIRNRLAHDYDSAKIQQLGRAIDALPYSPDWPASLGAKVFIHGEMRLVIDNLKDKYPFLSGASQPTSVDEDRGRVRIWWGREAWGLVIFNNQTSLKALQESGAAIILPLADNAYVISKNAD